MPQPIPSPKPVITQKVISVQAEGNDGKNILAVINLHLEAEWLVKMVIPTTIAPSITTFIIVFEKPV